MQRPKISIWCHNDLAAVKKKTKARTFCENKCVRITFTTRVQINKRLLRVYGEKGKTFNIIYFRAELIGKIKKKSLDGKFFWGFCRDGSIVNFLLWFFFFWVKAFCVMGFENVIELFCFNLNFCDSFKKFGQKFL